MPELVPTSAKGSVPSTVEGTVNQYGFKTDYSTSGMKRKVDEAEFGANVTNEIAMALLNSDLENKQFWRNAVYNDPSAEYKRLVASGMNPELAMRSVAGEGSQGSSSGLASGSVSPQNYSASRAAGTANVLTAARNLSTTLQDAAQSRLLRAQAENQEIKNRYEVRKQEGSTGMLELDLQKYKDTFNEQVNTIKSTYYNLTKQNQYLTTQIDNLAEQTRGLEISNNFNEDTAKTRADILSKELEKLNQDISIGEKVKIIKDVEASLAELGIMNGQNWYQSLISVAALGHGKEASEQVVKFIDDILSSATDKLPKLVSSIIKAVVSAPEAVLDGAIDYFKNRK